VVSTLVAWSYSAGQFVGAIQLGRPAEAFHRFHYRDSESFVNRRADWSDGGSEDRPAA
jgi:hypothetical protein